VLQLVNGELTIVANTGTEPVPMPEGELLMSSAELADHTTLPGDTTVWLLTEVFNESQS
jgi:alpha-glucosidase